MSTVTRTPASTLASADTTVRTIVANILSVYSRATDTDKANGAAWYLEANSFACELSIRHNVSVEKATAVIAHMSPRIHWGRNKKGADMVIGTGKADGFLTVSVNNALRAINSDDPISTLNGSKVKAFAANILGDTSRVTIDVWALRVAFNTRDFDEKWISRKGAYEAIEHCYKIAAKRIGIAPSELQAITWCVIRNGRAN